MRPEAHEGSKYKGPEIICLYEEQQGAKRSGDWNRENAGRVARNVSRAIIDECVGVNPLILRGNC